MYYNNLSAEMKESKSLLEFKHKLITKCNYNVSDFFLGWMLIVYMYYCTHCTITVRYNANDSLKINKLLLLSIIYSRKSILNSFLGYPPSIFAAWGHTFTGWLE